MTIRLASAAFIAPEIAIAALVAAPVTRTDVFSRIPANIRVEIRERLSWSRSLIFAAAALAALAANPASASAEDDGGASIWWVKALPFVKAAAYAKAIDDYCFASERYSFAPLELKLDDPRGRLSYMAYEQAKAGRMAFNGEFVEDDEAIRTEADLKAAAHLQNNFDACEPAIEFVENTVVSIPEMMPKLDAMAKKLEANRSATKEKVEATK